MWFTAMDEEGEAQGPCSPPPDEQRAPPLRPRRRAPCAPPPARRRTVTDPSFGSSTAVQSATTGLGGRAGCGCVAGLTSTHESWCVVAALAGLPVAEVEEKTLPLLNIVYQQAFKAGEEKKSSKK